jgi:peptidyl-prolyl cis-trans isomerase C
MSLSLGHRACRMLLVAVVSFAVTACGAGKPEVARVGDRDVDEADLRQATALQQVLADLQGTPCGGQPLAGESAAAPCDRAALSGELLWLAVSPYAEAHDIRPGSGAERAVEQLETQVGADELRGQLRARGLTRDDLLELGRKILTIRAVRTAIAAERIGDDELRSQYADRLVEFTTVEANHILLATRAEAEGVYRRVRDATRAQFAAVARIESTEPGADESGGDLGNAPATQFVPEFARAVAALEPGEISQPVQTQFGWHVIYLADKQVTPFEEARAGLLEPIADEEFQGWLEERATELGVEVNPRYGRFSAETFSVHPARSTDPSDATVPAGDAASPSP